MEEAREARRRKLVSRGADRLAFITGQSRSLPQPTPLDPPPPAGSSLPVEDVIGSVTTKSQASDQISSAQPKTEMSDEITRYEISNESVQHESDNQSVEVSPTTSVVDRSSNQVDYRATDIAPKKSCRVFIPREISRTISASENIRLLCSVVTALLAVLLYHGYSLGIKALGSIIGFRPLLLVLLTDATLIFGPLLVNQGNTQKSDGAARSTVVEEDGWTINIGSMLEAAMLLQKALSAVFMDCSICAVIMICGIAV